MIPDSHSLLRGLCPVLFTLRGTPVSSYAFFMVLGLGAALLCFWLEKRALPQPGPRAWIIIPGALLFGGIGAKLLALALNWAHLGSLDWARFLYSGRTIVGGLIGGWLGVKLLKKLFGIQARFGNAIAPAACLGIAIGRLGCFFGSCCWGKSTALPVGVDFGDGQFRHPTQIYEAVFTLGLFFYFHARNRQPAVPGILFRRFLLAYFAFRFFVEFIRDEPPAWLGLTAFQIISLVVVAFLAAGAGMGGKNGACKSCERRGQSLQSTRSSG